ncbi:polysaccharide biosynthesis C-terminal domain-containing protein [Marivirga sp. S37H4]|uniref:Polysaccharide biosynthesis C-terminal domain-containing protein n=1 Tax=Marivirga aurantiaca TaxID=2802615 RepID=A0A934WYD3_9BACT|nr:polysaccharide biosynthesis C-terminal domain-containing protein [Marivirga aurantiaca]MBK6265172.1 polysaccharide biosynthesis C-terminal domain-containing protein [Marivirga aurantiaca]
MNPLKKLAGEAGLYGLPSILGRLLNYLLVPLHTGVFFPAQFGDIAKIYAYMAFLNIVYTYGMETAYFRFTARDKLESYYNITFTAVLGTSLVFSILIYLFAAEIIWLSQISVEPYIVQYLAAILFIDAIVAIPLAKLRLASKAKKFAFTRMSSIVLNILFNLLFLWFLPLLAENGLVSWTSEKPFDISYVFLANLLANLSMVIILYKELWQAKLMWSWEKLKPILVYAFPIFLMGMAGIAVEQLDKIIFEDLLPIGFYEDKTAKEALGIYSATFKLSIFMALAIQAFRYAGEPFFFSRADDKDAPELFAKILYYFVALSLVIWVGVSLNAELIGKIFLSSPAFREALFLVPILLLGKLFFGMYVNMSIWFKLTDRTYYGIYISLAGAAVTVIGNVVLVPLLGYTGSALAGVLAYFVMLVYCYISGQKYFHIPYPMVKIVRNIVFTGIFIALYFLLKPTDIWWNYGLGLVLSLTYIGVLFLYERKRIFSDKL